MHADIHVFVCFLQVFSSRAKLKSRQQYRCVGMEPEWVVGGRQPQCKLQPITCLGDDSPLLARAHRRRQHICCEDEEQLTAPPYRNHQMCTFATCAYSKGTTSYRKCFNVPITRNYTLHIEQVLFKTSMSYKRHLNMNVQI